MKKEATWLYAPCPSLILKYLAIKPRSLMELRKITRIPWNYVNILIKKLESKGFVKCLTPKERIGKIYCINPETKDLVERILKESGHNPQVNLLLKLNWKAYGRLNCGTCKQIRKVFYKAVSFRNRGIIITEPNLESGLKDKNEVLQIDRSDIYRALRQIKKLGLIVPVKKKRRPLEYEITQEALDLLVFLNSQ